LLSPSSIAVVGGGTWCENVIEQCRKIGFSGAIWPVHHTRAEISGLASFPSVSHLPAAPDATFIGVNRKATIEIVFNLARGGAGGAVCFAAGFAEAEGEDATALALQKELLKAAAGMPILGPNCYGFVNYFERVALWPDQHGGLPTDRGVAIVTQSSNIAINISMQRRALPIGIIITAGNQAQTTSCNIATELLSDPRVTAIGMHIEGIRDVVEFELLAQDARRKGTPLVVLKAGRSATAREAAISHTASLTGSEAGAQAAFARLGVTQVEDIATFVEVLKLLHVGRKLRTGGISAMSCSGGEASLLADMADARGIKFAKLTKEQQTRLRTTLGPLVKIANPLDYHTYVWGDTKRMAETFAAMASQKATIALIVADFPRSDRCETQTWNCIVDAAILAKRRASCPLSVVATLPENMPEDIAKRLINHRIIPFSGLSEALTAISAASAASATTGISSSILRPRPPKAARTLNEVESKAELARHGVKIPAGKVASSKNQLKDACHGLNFPLALKGLGTAHKTDVGEIALELYTTEDVFDAACNMGSTEFLLEEMHAGAVAELLVGVLLDEVHGYVLTLGAGGIFAEVLTDTVSLLVPSNANDVRDALSKLKISALLSGYRARPSADMQAIVDAILAVQEYVASNHGRVEEVEINPLLAMPRGAIAVDALIRIGDEA